MPDYWLFVPRFSTISINLKNPIVCIFILVNSTVIKHVHRKALNLKKILVNFYKT